MNVDAKYKRERWMICYRQGVEYEQINTNNLIEAWHRTLKIHFFHYKQQRRLDKFIYILTKNALTFFEQKDINYQFNVCLSSPAQKQVGVAVKKAMRFAALKKRSYMSFLSAQPRVEVLVESFENADQQYVINIDFAKNSAGEIHSCSCPVFSSGGKCCKHIAMVILAYDRLPVFKRRSNWEPPKWEQQGDEFKNEMDAYAEESAAPNMNDLQHVIDELKVYIEMSDLNNQSESIKKGLQDLVGLYRKHYRPEGTRE
ncbi:hypothetical protein BGX27_005560, partial [Mortierella sp. AM989]